jgi:hypothetical protein
MVILRILPGNIRVFGVQEDSVSSGGIIGYKTGKLFPFLQVHDK